MTDKLQLVGFNNLTKSLSFNIYDVCYAVDAKSRQEYIEYIDEEYNAERLTKILEEVATRIGANVLNIARQDYEPHGASVTMLVSEGPVEPRPDQVLAHLDKSHICVHTYPETNSETGISTFRVDIDVSTCGTISPLTALDYLIESFESDLVMIDYKVRGFTRDTGGHKHFIDHWIINIQQFISWGIKKKYTVESVSLPNENVFAAKMMLKDFDLENYLFGSAFDDLNCSERRKIRSFIEKEMTEIFYARNIS